MSIPPAPRAPHFPEPSARGHHYSSPTGPMRGVPVAPGSLAPVAMASARNAVATGPQAAMAAMDIGGPSRPSTKAGMSILLAGAIIGGLIGAVMHARQSAADAFAAQQTHEAAPLPAAFAPPIASGAGVLLAPETKDVPKDSTKKDTHADATSGDRAAEKDAKKKTGQKRVTWTAPKSSPKVTDATGGDDEAPAPKAKKGKKDDDDGWTVASAGGEDAPKKGEKGEKAAKEDKPSSSKKADKPAKKGGDDAVNVLKAAMGATENTL